MSKTDPTLRVRVHGAAGEVTGSCYEVSTRSTRLLVDFGMFQGSVDQERRNAVAPELDFASLSSVIVTHAHIDHCGRLGMLPRLGFTGSVLATEPTAELLPRVLISSATLQQVRIDEHRAGTQPITRVVAPAHLATPRMERAVPPPVLFMHRDADRIRTCIRAIPLMEWEPVGEDLEMRFLNASHVIGAASVELRAARGAGRDPAHLLISGDIGPIGNPLLAPHQWPDRRPDLLLMECTNGARTFAHADQLPDLIAILREARAKQQRVLVPVFALGRAQSLLQLLARASRAGELADLPVYLDTAMGCRATELYARFPHLLEPSIRNACMRGGNPLHFPELHTLMSRRESESIDRIRSACVVLAGSGFCDAGPILRHVGLAIDRPDTRVLFTGHQLEGSLGLGLQNGATKIEINDVQIEVRAKIDRIEGISGHADAADLREWVARMPGAPARIALVHGSEAARAEFARSLAGSGASEVLLPTTGQTIEVE